MTHEAIRQLVASDDLQLSLLDERNLAEITFEDYLEERLVVCYNPMLDEERDRKRKELLEATANELAKIGEQVA